MFSDQKLTPQKKLKPLLKTEPLVHFFSNLKCPPTPLPPYITLTHLLFSKINPILPKLSTKKIYRAVLKTAL